MPRVLGNKKAIRENGSRIAFHIQLAEGHTEDRGHSAHLGFLAVQISRPKCTNR